MSPKELPEEKLPGNKSNVVEFFTGETLTQSKISERAEQLEAAKRVKTTITSPDEESLEIEYYELSEEQKRGIIKVVEFANIGTDNFATFRILLSKKKFNQEELEFIIGTVEDIILGGMSAYQTIFQSDLELLSAFENIRFGCITIDPHTGSITKRGIY